MTKRQILISTSDPNIVRALAKTDSVVSLALFPAESNGHKFSVGEHRTLVGLVDFPEHNGEQVEITAIREDGPRGKAYYVKGEINQFVNWVYEYRLI